jgi:hypothetical protein
MFTILVFTVKVEAGGRGQGAGGRVQGEKNFRLELTKTIKNPKSKIQNK